MRKGVALLIPPARILREALRIAGAGFDGGNTLIDAHLRVLAQLVDIARLLAPIAVIRQHLDGHTRRRLLSVERGRLAERVGVTRRRTAPTTVASVITRALSLRGKGDYPMITGRYVNPASSSLIIFYTHKTRQRPEDETQIRCN